MIFTDENTIILSLSPSDMVDLTTVLNELGFEYPVYHGVYDSLTVDANQHQLAISLGIDDQIGLLKVNYLSITLDKNLDIVGDLLDDEIYNLRMKDLDKLVKEAQELNMGY